MHYSDFEITNELEVKSQSRYVINALVTQHYKRFFIFNRSKKLKIWRYSDEDVWRSYGREQDDLPSATLCEMELKFRNRFQRTYNSMEDLLESMSEGHRDTNLMKKFASEREARSHYASPYSRHRPTPRRRNDGRGNSRQTVHHHDSSPDPLTVAAAATVLMDDDHGSSSRFNSDYGVSSSYSSDYSSSSSDYSSSSSSSCSGGGSFD